MKQSFDFEKQPDIAWCPGCGNFQIRQSLLDAFESLSLDKTRTVMVSGIGQAAKMPQYINTHFFNGLHGRALPVAVSIKAANPGLTVIAEGGDGDMYGEGGNHFIHNIRRNPDIAHIVHNNMVYGLTKGQASPTSRKGFITPVQVSGVINEPLNPLALALVLGAGFVARSFSGDAEKTKELIMQAVEYPGYALVDIFHPCVSFNKVNTFKWYRDNTVWLDETHDISSFENALSKAMSLDPFYLGVLYKGDPKPVFHTQLAAYKNDTRPLFQRNRNMRDVSSLLGV